MRTLLAIALVLLTGGFPTVAVNAPNVNPFMSRRQQRRNRK